jgi:thiamine biosynthesis protein ThiI
MDRKLMIHFGELMTKGKNRKNFVKQLEDNIKHALKSFNVTYDVSHDHIYISFLDKEKDAIISRLQDVSGIHAISEILVIDNKLETLQQVALEIAKDEKKKTFKIETRRLYKQYPLVSDAINRQIARVILQNTNMKVDVHNPELLLKIQIYEKEAFIFYKTYSGSGGYPLGVGAKSLLLLSGGIDSPVAAYHMLRRGMKLECIHFAAPPYTSQAVIDKLKELLSVLNKYQPQIKLHIIPFTKIQEAIYKEVPEPYCITIMRRAMFKIATKVARQIKARALVTGESLGQVASQTLESIDVINEVTNIPIIRPLATVDKIDIIKTAMHIGTYEISIIPYEDCCTIFNPRNPTTCPKLENCLEYEARIVNLDEMIDISVKEREIIIVKEQEESKFF